MDDSMKQLFIIFLVSGIIAAGLLGFSKKFLRTHDKAIEEANNKYDSFIVSAERTIESMSNMDEKELQLMVLESYKGVSEYEFKDSAVAKYILLGEDMNANDFLKKEHDKYMQDNRKSGGYNPAAMNYFLFR